MPSSGLVRVSVCRPFGILAVSGVRPSFSPSNTTSTGGCTTSVTSPGSVARGAGGISSASDGPFNAGAIGPPFAATVPFGVPSGGGVGAVAGDVVVAGLVAGAGVAAVAGVVSGAGAGAGAGGVGGGAGSAWSG